MNLQATDAHPFHSAIAMDDKRVSKMTLETAQLYCTVTATDTYRPTHQHHPLCKWAKRNLPWLIAFHTALATEHFYRTGNMHKSFIDVGQHMIEPAWREPRAFMNCARSPKIALNNQPIDFTTTSDVHLAYRYYLRSRWRHDTIRARWTRRRPPLWLDEPLINRATPYPLLIRSVDIVQTDTQQWSCIYGR